MLSTFFSTSKPVHYLLMALLLMLAIAGLIFSNEAYDWTAYLLMLPALVAVGLIQFIVLKNELTRSNTYAIFVFMVMLLVLFTLNIQWQPIASLILLLLALRRLLSLRNATDTVKKIFDASFWTSIACLLESWSSLFFIVIYLSIFLFARHQFRYWIVPVIAVMSVWIITFTIDQFVTLNLFEAFYNGGQLDPVWEYQRFQSQHILVICIAAITIMAVFFYLMKYTSLQKSERPQQIVLISIGLITIFLFLFSFETFLNHGSLWMIIVPAIMIVRIVQKLKSKLWKELLLWIPVALLVIALVIS